MLSCSHVSKNSLAPTPLDDTVPTSVPLSVLEKSEFKYLNEYTPFHYFQFVERLSGRGARHRHLCVLTESSLALVKASSGRLSYCVRVEDVDELVTDAHLLSIGVCMRERPFGSVSAGDKYAEMSVDVLFFAQTPGLFCEFVDAFRDLYERRTGEAMHMRERDAHELYSATLTLEPDGRRTRKLASLRVAAPPPPRRHAAAEADTASDSILGTFSEGSMAASKKLTASNGEASATELPLCKRGADPQESSSESNRRRSVPRQTSISNVTPFERSRGNPDYSGGPLGM